LQPVRADADDDEAKARQNAGRDPEGPREVRLTAEQPCADGSNEVEVDKSDPTTDVIQQRHQPLQPPRVIDLLFRNDRDNYEFIICEWN